MAKKRDLQEIDIVSKELEALKKQSSEYVSADEKAAKQKKTFVVLCAVFVLLVVVVVTGVLIYTSSLSPVSYGPNALASEKTEEKTKEHERRLKIIDEKGGSREGVNFVGYYARFDDEDNLVVDGYMRNFTGHNIKNITGNITVATVSGDNVGGAYFEFPVEEFGVLKNGHSRPWRLIFNSDYVNIEIVDLSEFTVTTEFEFYKE